MWILSWVEQRALQVIVDHHQRHEHGEHPWPSTADVAVVLWPATRHNLARLNGPAARTLVKLARLGLVRRRGTQRQSTWSITAQGRANLHMLALGASARKERRKAGSAD